MNTQPKKEIDDLNQQVFLLRDKDTALALKLAEKALAMSLPSSSAPEGYLRGISESKTHIAHDLYLKSQFNEGVKLTDEIFSLTPTPALNRFWAHMLGIAGICKSRNAQYAEGLQHFRQMEAYAKETEDDANFARSQIGLGLIFSEVGNFRKATAYQQRAFDHYEQTENLRGLATCYNNLGIDNFYLGDYEKALQLSQKSYELALKIEHAPIIGLSTLNMGKANLGLGNFDEAKTLFEKTVSFAEANEIKFLLCFSLYELGAITHLDGDFEFVLDLLNRCESLSDDIGLLQSIDLCYLEQSKALKKLNRFEEALIYYEKYVRIREDALEPIRGMLLINEESATNDDLLKANQVAKNLEARIVERTHDLAEAVQRERLLKQELEKSLIASAEMSELKSQMISFISHEFRTPLAIINNSSSLLTQHAEKLTGEKRALQFQRITESIHSLTALLDDISTVHLINSDQYEPVLTQQTFGALAQLLAGHFQAQAPAATIEFIFDGSDETIVTVDFDKLKVIGEALVSNAVKFSAENKPITVTIENAASQLKLIVKDQGIGFQPEDLPHVFDLFYRGSNIKTVRGLGIGLYTARRLTEVLGGTISAKSTKAGTRLCVSIPVPKANII